MIKKNIFIIFICLSLLVSCNDDNDDLNSLPLDEYPIFIKETPWDKLNIKNYQFAYKFTEKISTSHVRVTVMENKEPLMEKILFTHNDESHYFSSIPEIINYSDSLDRANKAVKLKNILNPEESIQFISEYLKKYPNERIVIYSNFSVEYNNDYHYPEHSCLELHYIENNEIGLEKVIFEMLDFIILEKSVN